MSMNHVDVMVDIMW